MTGAYATASRPAAVDMAELYGLKKGVDSTDDYGEFYRNKSVNHRRGRVTKNRYAHRDKNATRNIAKKFLHAARQIALSNVYTRINIR